MAMSWTSRGQRLVALALENVRRTTATEHEDIKNNPCLQARHTITHSATTYLHAPERSKKTAVIVIGPKRPRMGIPVDDDDPLLKNPRHDDDVLLQTAVESTDDDIPLPQTPVTVKGAHDAVPLPQTPVEAIHDDVPLPQIPALPHTPVTVEGTHDDVSLPQTPALPQTPVTLEGTHDDVPLPQTPVTVEGTHDDVPLPQTPVTVEGTHDDVPLPQTPVTVEGTHDDVPLPQIPALPHTPVTVEGTHDDVPLPQTSVTVEGTHDDVPLPQTPVDATHVDDTVTLTPVDARPREATQGSQADEDAGRTDEDNRTDQVHVDGESASEDIQTKRRRKAQEKVAYYRDKYPLLPPCKDSCRKKCQEKITEEHRTLINKTFWGLNFSGRRGWFDSHITIYAIKQRTIDVVGQHAKRRHSLSYRLPLPTGMDIHVCKEMFMHTVGIKTDGMITEYLNAKVKGPDTAVSPTTEGRGHHDPPNKFNKEFIREHINSYRPVVSHYKINHAPLRRYLEPGLTISAMWRDFCEKIQKISFELYRKVFESERITFGEPSQDECESCLAYKLHCKESCNNEDHDPDTCEICVDGRAHEVDYTKARIEYQKEVPVNCNVYTVDMQRVILLPKLSTKESFFVSRLIVFNETFARVRADGQPDYVLLWHEGKCGRLAQDVASTYIKCIVIDSSANILFWADNCGGQNKNWTLYTALTQCVNAGWGPQEVVIKYLQKGHTFMRADSIHGSIGKKMKAQENIYTFDDFVNICKKASKSITPIVMEHYDFFEFSGQQRARSGKKTKMPLLGNVCEVKFTKGKRTMQYKEDFGDQYSEVDFLKAKFDVTGELPPRRTEPRGIPKTKKDGILKLLHVAPSAKKLFWLEIPENNVNDLAESLI